MTEGGVWFNFFCQSDFLYIRAFILLFHLFVFNSFEGWVLGWAYDLAFNMVSGIQSMAYG